MSLSPQQIEKLVSFDCGDEIAAALNSILFDVIALYADKDAQDASGRLCYLYAKRHALGVLMGHTWQDVDRKAESASADFADRFAHLKTLHDSAQAEITTTEATLRAGRGGAVGCLSVREPQPPPCGLPDMNSPYYRGLPYSGPRGPWRP